MAGKFVLKDAADKFRFNLVAGNGEIIAQSQAYKSKESALAGIESVRKNAPMPRSTTRVTAPPAPSLALGRVGAASASGAGSAPFQRPSDPLSVGASLSGGEDPLLRRGPVPALRALRFGVVPSSRSRCSEGGLRFAGPSPAVGGGLGGAASGWR